MSDNLHEDRSKIEFLEDFYELLSKEIIVAYRGTFEKRVLNVLARNIESSVQDNLVLKRKFFRIFLEFSQNIAYYSSEQVETADNELSGAGMLILKHGTNGNYMFMSGNMVKNDMLKYINERVELINSLDRDELRQYKREQLKLVETGVKNNLGILQIVLISGNPIVVKTMPLNDTESFIIITAEVPSYL